MACSTADAPTSGAAGGTAASGLAALRAPAELVGETPEAAVCEAERAGLLLEEADRAGLVRAVGEDDAECVGRVLAVGEAEWVGLALVVGEAEWVGLALAVGEAEWVGLALVVGEAEWVGLALAVGEAECVELALADGDWAAVTDVDGDADVVEVDGAADADCDDVPVVDGWGELDAGVAAPATAKACPAMDNPQLSRATATRRVTTARR